MGTDPSLAKPNRGSVLFGFVVGAGLTSLALTLASAYYFSPLALLNTPIANGIEEACFTAIFWIGLVQWIYVLPIIIYYLRKRQTRLATGLLIAALLVLATNISCWMQLRNIKGDWRF